MTRIGTRALAAAVFYSHHNGAKWGESLDESEWESLCGGSTRNVWLHRETNTVYKTQSGYGSWIDDYGNDVELKNVRALQKLQAEGYFGTHVSIPRTGGFRFWDSDHQTHRWIIAMEFVKGTVGAFKAPSHEARQELYNLGLSDMHGHNYIVDDNGHVWPIDLGSRWNGWEGGSDQRALGSANMNM